MMRLPQANRRQALSTIAGSLASLWINSSLSCIAQPQALKSSIVRYVKPARFRIRHSVTVQRNETDLTALECWIPLPTNWPEQKISKVVIQPDLAPVRAADGHSQVVKWFINDPSALRADQFAFQLEYECTRSEIQTDMRRLNVQKYRPYPTDNPDVAKYLAPETKIQSGSDELKNVVARFMGKQRPWVHLAYDLYSFVLDRVTYQLVAGFKGAEYCFQQQHGECGDYSALFVALCRTAGIPARICPGYHLTGKPDDYHVWAEFLLPTGEWIPVDGSFGDGDIVRRRQHFGQMANHRIAMIKTADVELADQEYGHQQLDFLQTGAWWWWGTGGRPEPKFDFQVTPLTT